MSVRSRRALAVLALLAPALAWGQEPAVKESVAVSLVQVEVTVWPKKEGSDACLGLGKDDFELEVGGKSRPIYSVDAVGLEEEVYSVPGQYEDAPGPGGMSVVLLFDLCHLDLFFKGYPACPRGLELAFREARRYLEEEFRDGDRLLLVTLGGWPVVHEGWIRTRDDGLRALQRLQKNRHVLRDAGRGHVHHNGWIAGLESLFLAMGRYPGRKDVIWLVEDFSHDDVAMRIFELAARAQANRVVVSAVDLLHTCRSIQGPGCPRAAGNGLACTVFKVPVGLSYSRDTGGSLYRNESIARAVAALREGRKCRYLVSFTGASTQKKRPQRITLRLRGDRRDLSLAAPSAYETPARAATAKEREEALFLLPRFGRGLAAEAAIWPYRAAAKKAKKEKKQKWDVLALARLEHTDDEDWPEDLTEMTVHVLLRTESKIHGSYKKTIAGQELTALRAAGATRLLMFPLPDVPAGEVTLDLTVTSNVAGVAANVRKHQAVPVLPRPGEAGPWFLSDHLVRLGDRAVMAPSLDGHVTRGEPAWMLGYGCPPKRGAPSSYEAELVSSSGTTSVPVSLSWLPGLRHEHACGWLFGSIATDLAPDVWRFDPPAALAPAVSGEDLEFMVEGGPGETRTVSTEVSPR